MAEWSKILQQNLQLWLVLGALWACILMDIFCFVLVFSIIVHICNCFFTGLVGLAISYALTITNQLSGVVTSFTETEKQMVSVERAMQYVSGVPQEVDGLTIVSFKFILRDWYFYGTFEQYKWNRILRNYSAIYINIVWTKTARKPFMLVMFTVSNMTVFYFRRNYVPDY